MSDTVKSFIRSPVLKNQSQSTPQSNFLNLSFEALNQVSVSLPARALPIEVLWIGGDGRVHQSSIIDNLEAYAINAPIFALPASDNLTGSLHADTFVIAKSLPFVQDVIFNFDVKQDTLHFLEFSDTHQFSDLILSKGLGQNTLISLDNGNHSVLLYGVNPMSLTPAHCLFDEAPYTLNTDRIDIGIGAIIPFKGILENIGTIRVDGTLIMEGELKGNGEIVVGPLGALEMIGQLSQDLIFETHSIPVTMPYYDVTLGSMIVFSVQVLIDNLLTVA